MKITVRIPTVQYGYQEVEFESIDEYNKLMPEFFAAYKQMKKTLNAKTDKSQHNINDTNDSFIYGVLEETRNFEDNLLE